MNTPLSSMLAWSLLGMSFFVYCVHGFLRRDASHNESFSIGLERSSVMQRPDMVQ